jgi:hypothetical protein
LKHLKFPDLLDMSSRGVLEYAVLWDSLVKELQKKLRRVEEELMWMVPRAVSIHPDLVGTLDQPRDCAEVCRSDRKSLLSIVYQRSGLCSISGAIYALSASAI